MLSPKEIDNYFYPVAQNHNKASTTVGHTRHVMMAKLVLPIVAVILILTLLILPSLKKDIHEFELDFIISTGDIEKLNVEKTTVYITDNNNRINHFTATEIKETAAGTQQYDLVSPYATLPINDKDSVIVKSPKGLYNQKTNLLRLQNLVEIIFSRGMTFQTKEIFFDFKKSFGYTKQPITGSGFLGKVDAKGLEVNTKSEILTFLGNTKIIIDEESLSKE